MSDSELSDAPSATTLPDSTLEKSLRQEVIKAQKAGVDLTVNSIRTASETALGLETGFYKSHAKWSGKSKQIIREQHVSCCGELLCFRQEWTNSLSITDLLLIRCRLVIGYRTPTTRTSSSTIPTKQKGRKTTKDPGRANDCKAQFGRKRRVATKEKEERPATGRNPVLRRAFISS